MTTEIVLPGKREGGREWYGRFDVVTICRNYSLGNVGFRFGCGVFRALLIIFFIFAEGSLK